MKDTATPKVSIIIATYNAGKELEACIASIAAQPTDQLELIIMDGGSTDETLHILQAQQHSWLHWQTGPDKGIYDALNKGAALAKGAWVYFMGADDRLQPGFGEMLTLLKDPFTVYYGNSEPFYGQQQPAMELLSGHFSKYRLAKHCMNHQAIIYPAAVFRKYQYDLQYKVYADYAMNIKVWGDAEFKQEYHPLTIALYNMTGFSALNNDLPFKRDKMQLIRKHMGWWMYTKMRFKLLKKRMQGEADFWDPKGA